MRTLFIIAFLLCFASTGHAQTCSNTTVGAFTCITSITGGTTTAVSASGFVAGQTVIVAAYSNATHNFASGDISSTDGGAWTFFSNCLSGADSVAVWYKAFQSTFGSSDTITVTASKSTAALVYTGVGLIDGAGICGTGNSTTPSSGNYTVAIGDLNLGFAIAAGGSLTVGSGWNFRVMSTGGGFSSNARGEDQVAASTTANSTWTATTGVWAVIGLAFKIPAVSSGSAISGPATIAGPLAVR